MVVDENCHVTRRSSTRKGKMGLVAAKMSREFGQIQIRHYSRLLCFHAGIKLDGTFPEAPR
jgi:hypothetical protein